MLDEVKSFGLLDNFVGGHPMAGTAHSGWAAGDARAVRRRAVGAQRRRPCRPRRLGDGHGVGVGLRRRRGAGQIRRARRRRGRHLAPAASARRGAGRHRGRGAAGIRLGGRIVPRRHAGGGDGAGSGARDVRSEFRTAAARARPVDRTAEAGAQVAGRRRDQWPNWSRKVTPRACAISSFRRSQIVTIVIGQDGWRDELAAAGRAGGVIKSALPVLGNRG